MKRWVIAVMTGIALGLAARLIDDVAPRWVGNVGAVWFLAGFLLGRGAPRLREGAFLGAAGLILATLTYYAWRLGVDGTISTYYLSSVGAFWLTAAAIAGTASGGLGAASNRRPQPWGIAIGVLIGEAAAVAVLSQRFEQVVVELAGAAAITASSRHRLREHVPVVGVTTTVVALVALGYRLALH